MGQDNSTCLPHTSGIKQEKGPLMGAFFLFCLNMTRQVQCANTESVDFCGIMALLVTAVPAHGLDVPVVCPV